MPKKHTSIKLYSETDTSPQKIYDIKLGSVHSVSDDYNNGIYFNLDGATDLYNFFLNHPNEKFLINNCEGLEIEVSSIDHNEYYNAYYYSDAEMTQKIPIINISF